MYPVDFEEFMEYMGEELLLEYISDCFKKQIPLEQKLHAKAMHLFKEYILVGGMPQAVVRFLETHDINQVNNVLIDVDFGYRQDIAKY